MLCCFFRWDQSHQRNTLTGVDPEVGNKSSKGKLQEESANPKAKPGQKEEEEEEEALDLTHISRIGGAPLFWRLRLRLSPRVLATLATQVPTANAPAPFRLPAPVSR